MRALPLNDVSWLGLVSMRAGGGVGQGELQKGAGSSSRVGSSPFPLGQAVGALPGCEGAATQILLLPTASLSCAGPLQKGL